MPLTNAEKLKLEAAKKKFVSGSEQLGTAIKEGSSALAKSALTNLRRWLDDVEKSFGEKK